MFTFGYKTTLSSILRSLASIGIGLVMIFDNEASETVVKVVAAFLFASGLVSLVYGLIRNKKEGLLPLMAVNAVVDILIGVLLFLNPGWVAGFIITLIGIVLILFGGLQLLALAGTMSLLGTGFGTLILSVCAVVGSPPGGSARLRRRTRSASTPVRSLSRTRTSSRLRVWTTPRRLTTQRWTNEYDPSGNGTENP